MSGVGHRTDRVAWCRGAVEEPFRARVEQGTASSSVFAVFTAEGIAVSGGFAAQEEIPTFDTAFRIASCTTSFTAAAVLLLCDRGLLSLDDPVDAHVEVGRCTGAGDGSSTPMLGMLGSMSGGLATDDPWADRQESLAPQAFDALVARGIHSASPPRGAAPATRSARSPLRHGPTGGGEAAVEDGPVRDVPTSDGAIRLGQFLKLADLIGSGADARPLVTSGAVSVNGVVVRERGRQLRRGDVVAVEGNEARVA